MRRYVCRACGHSITVLPRELIARRLYSASAIGLALAIWALLGKSACETRSLVSPWRTIGATSASGWPVLVRWVAAIDDGRLFPRVRGSPPGWPPRRRAARAATTLQAHAPPALRDADIATQVFAGAALAA